ncbi:MAG: 8-amino-7-oxononanoate synthase [Chitinophagaceae bacterium]
MNDSLKEILQQRKEEALYRYLQVNNNLIDFCSNDYLSFARSEIIRQQVKTEEERLMPLSGATGSRSISGNTSFAEELEKFIAAFHHAEAGLLFNSGYDANLGLFSCIARKGDTIICDELIHASIIDGCRLSYAGRFRFDHNDLEHLEKKLKQAAGNIFVVVESVYSMDGDIAPLKDIVLLCQQYNANLIVDEAHATGVFGKQGRGLVSQLGLEKDVFARVHTFGKAIGCHGAIVIGSNVLRNYLINFARSFIFTTALPMHSLLTIRCAYEQLLANEFDNAYLHTLIQHFNNGFPFTDDVYLIKSVSPVQSLIIPGNKRVRNISSELQREGFDIRAIVSPSVPAGKERLRISLHMHNTVEQVDELKQSLHQILFT